MFLLLKNIFMKATMIFHPDVRVASKILDLSEKENKTPNEILIELVDFALKNIKEEYQPKS